jgi:hypothetical protein
MSELTDVGRTFLRLFLILSPNAWLLRAFWESEQVRDRRRHTKGWILLVGLFGLVTWPAPGRDLDGRYATSPLKPWFDQLKSRTGPCCSNADGYVVEDADWEAKNGHYRVRVPEYPDSRVTVWIDVPDESVITEHNRAGLTMVWPVYSQLTTEGESNHIWIRCFMPGSMT